MNSSSSLKKTGNQPGINLLSLSFTDKQLENEYKLNFLQESLRGIRIIHILTLIIYASFGMMDIALVKNLNPLLTLMRYAVVCPLLLLGLFSTFHPAYSRFHQFEIHLMAFLVEASLMLVSYSIGPNLDHIYLDGLVIIILFSYILVRGRFIWITTTNLLVFVFFLYLNEINPIVWQDHILSNFLRFSLTNVLGAVICYVLEFSSKRRFILLHLLKKEQENSRMANQLLEKNVEKRTAELTEANKRLLHEIQEHRETYHKLIHERASLEQRVIERTAELGLANNEMARALRMRNEFLANMSHELRTPLNAILGMSEILLERTHGRLDETSTRHLNTIQDSGNHLLTLINNVLDLAKIESSRMSLLYEDISIEMVCQASVQSVQRAALAKNITVHFDIEDSCGYIRADPLRLKQMLFNLLDNAVKFTPQDGEVGLEVCCQPQHEAIQFTVWDTGIGIKPEQIDYLFMPFVQVDSSLTRSYEGTGMGLVLVARLAEIHGGSVSVQSSGLSGEGARFSIWLPSSSYQYYYSPVFKPEASADNLVECRFKHALLVDDTPDSSNELARELELLGIHSQVCLPDNEEVHTHLLQETDIIFLNMQQPDKEDWQLLQRLKDDPHTRNIPVILISSANEQVSGLGMGADAFLIEPIYPIKLQRTLRRIARLQKYRQGKALQQKMFTILIVEDNEITIDMLTDVLLKENEDYRLIIARSGLESIERAREARPNAVLIDAQTPDIDGVSVLKRLRKLPDMQHTPIIAMTSIDTEAERNRCLLAGANTFLRKPINFETLIQKLESFRA